MPRCVAFAVHGAVVGIVFCLLLFGCSGGEVRLDPRPIELSSQDAAAIRGGAFTVGRWGGRSSGRRGLVVSYRRPGEAIGGVEEGDVLLAVDGRDVDSALAVASYVRQEHARGVRQFATRWLSGGVEVERIYVVPDE